MRPPGARSSRTAKMSCGPSCAIRATRPRCVACAAFTRRQVVAHSACPLRCSHRCPADVYRRPQLCRTFATSGTCPYGTRCRFIHYRGAAPVPSALPGVGGAKLTLTVPPGSPRSPRVAPFMPAQPASPAEAAGGAGPGSPPPSPQSPAALRASFVPEGAPRAAAAAAAAIHAGAAMPETPPCTPPRSGGGEDGCNNSSGSDDSAGRARGRSRLPIFQTLCTATGAGGKELPTAAPPSPAAAPAPGAAGGAGAVPPKSPKKKNGPTAKPPPPVPNRAAMQLRRGAVCE